MSLKETNSPFLCRRPEEGTWHRSSDGEFSRKWGAGVSSMEPSFYTPGHLCLHTKCDQFLDAQNTLEYSRKNLGFRMRWPRLETLAHHLLVVGLRLSHATSQNLSFLVYKGRGKKKKKKKISNLHIEIRQGSDVIMDRRVLCLLSNALQI